MIFLRNQELPSQEGEPTAAPRRPPNSSSLRLSLFKPTAQGQSGYGVGYPRSGSPKFNSRSSRRNNGSDNPTTVW